MKKKRRRINNKIDLIFLLLFLLLGLCFTVEAIIGNLIPIKYICIFFLIVLLLFAVIFLTFKVRNQAFRFFRRIFTVLLCVILLIGTIFQGQLRSAFSNVIGSIYSDYMYVLVDEKSSLSSMKEVKKVGYFDDESGLLLYALTQLKDVDTQGYDSIEEELQAYKNDEIDAVLISAKDASFYKDDLKNYKKIYEIEKITKEDVIKSDLSKKPFVIYLAGIDNMGPPTQMGLHDVNMLLMVNPLNHHVDVISINRDSYVPNSQLGYYPDKLTHFGWYGPEMASSTLETIFGIEIDYYAKVTFESLIKIIDAMGGIDVDVKISFTEQDENRSFHSSDVIRLEKGYQHLNGSQALAYARHRKTAGWGVEGREMAQRDIIKAIIDKMLSVEGALKIGDVLNVGASYVSTNLSMDSAKAFIKKAIDERESWSISSLSVTSDAEKYLKCAMEGNVYRSVVLLENKDIYNVHHLYQSMFEDEGFDDFAFDLNDLGKYIETFTLDKYVITIENYYDVVPRYFPDYLY